MLIEWTAIHSESLIHWLRRRRIKYNFSAEESHALDCQRFCCQYQTQTSHGACKNAQLRYRIWPKLQMKNKLQVQGARRWAPTAVDNAANWSGIKSSRRSTQLIWQLQPGDGSGPREIDIAWNEFKIRSHVTDNAAARRQRKDSWRTERMINVSLLICAINLPAFCWPPVKKFSTDYTQNCIHCTLLRKPPTCPDPWIVF